MKYTDWCAQPLADGRHRFDALPLPQLHPLAHGQLIVEIEVTAQRITSCRLDASGSRRGDEQLLEVRDFKQGLALINRHGWLTSAFADVLYARIIESALGMVVSERTRALRELVLTLNAAAAKVYWDAVDAALADEPASLEQRERILDVIERITGARMHVTYARIGGVAADIDASDIDAVRALGLADADAAVAAVVVSGGDIAIALPKVLRLPQGEYSDEIVTPHGVLGMRVVGKGDKVPQQVELRTAGSAAFAALEHAAIGMATSEFFLRLAHTRTVLGEVAR